MTKPIQIIGDLRDSNPAKGIASHPLYGFGNIRNVDVQLSPGAILLKNKTLASASTITGQVTWFVRDQTFAVGALYAVDDVNKVYKSTDNGVTWSVIGDGTGAGASGNGVGLGQGLAVWKNYLFSVGSTGVAVYGPLDGAAAWTRGLQALATVPFTISVTKLFAYNPALTSVDGFLYIGNQNTVFKLSEVVGSTFSPATAGTYNAITFAIIGSQYNISCLADLGHFLMIGTKIVGDSDNIYEQGADIFPFDKSNINANIQGIASDPIRVPENGIQMMVSVMNRLYFFAGRMGKLYVSDTSSYEQIAQIPNYIYGQESNPIQYFPGAIMFLQGKIYFGIGGGGTATTGNCGVWSYNPTTKALQIEHTISTGNDGSSQALYISALYPIGRKQILIGWRDVAVGYGIDYQIIGTYTKYTSYQGYIESALIKVGEVLGNRTIGNLEVALLNPLTTGQGVRVKWRSSLSSAWTTLATIDFATYGATQGQNISAATLTNLIYLQIRVELTSTGSDTPELQSVLLHPSL